MKNKLLVDTKINNVIASRRGTILMGMIPSSEGTEKRTSKQIEGFNNRDSKETMALDPLKV